MKKVLLSWMLIAGMMGATWAQGEIPVPDDPVIPVEEEVEDEEELNYVDIEDVTYSLVSLNTLPKTLTGTLSESDDLIVSPYNRNSVNTVGVAFTLSQSKTIDILLGSEFDGVLILLDNDFEMVSYNDDYYLPEGYDSYERHSRIIKTLAAGSYRLLVMGYDMDDGGGYTLKIDEIEEMLDVSEVAYQLIASGDTINDTLFSDSQMVGYDLYEETNLVKAKGYKFQAQEGNLVTIDCDVAVILLDADFNVVDIDNYIVMVAPSSGTYYLIVGIGDIYLEDEEDNIPFELTIDVEILKDYYIDYMNGNDNRNGLTPSTSVASFEKALDLSDGYGNFYLMSDYVLGNDEGMEIIAGSIRPYQQDIRIKCMRGDDDRALNVISGKDLTIGDASNNYKFIIDSVVSVSPIIRAEGRLRINNVTFKHDTVDNMLVESYRDKEINKCLIDSCALKYGIECEYNKLEFRNSTMSHCYVETTAIGVYNDGEFIFENSSVKENEFGAIGIIIELSNAHFKSGTIQNNFGNFDVINGLSNRNKGGLASVWSELVFGTGFAMDQYNYVMLLDTNDVITLEGVPTASHVATILPLQENGESAELVMREGRTVLTDNNNGTVVAQSYNRFDVAQLTMAMWYIGNDGKLTTTMPQDEPETPGTEEPGTEEPGTEEPGTEEPAGIDDVTMVEATVYPNPATEYVMIDCSSLNAGARIVLTDINGRTIEEKNVENDGMVRFDIGALAKGVYMMRVESEGSVMAVNKVVKR